MPLPARTFYTLTDAAIKWDCLPSNIVGWAAVGKLEIVISVSYAVAEGNPMAGLLAVPGEDLLPLFRKGAQGSDAQATATIRRLRQINSKAKPWLFFDTPEQGLTVTVDDILILQDEYEAFSKQIGVGMPKRYNAPKYDWDAMYVALIKRIHLEGLPKTKTALLKEMQDWFSRNSEDGEFPDERTMRSRIYPVYEAIMNTDDAA